jgi:hypothetical protein
MRQIAPLELELLGRLPLTVEERAELERRAAARIALAEELFAWVPMLGLLAYPE